MELLVVIAVIALVVVQLERTDRGRRRQPAAPYVHPLDRDARRVAAEIATARARFQAQALDAAPASAHGVQSQWSRHA